MDTQMKDLLFKKEQYSEAAFTRHGSGSITTGPNQKKLPIPTKTRRSG